MKVCDKIKLKEKFSINFVPSCVSDMLEFEGKIVTIEYIYHYYTSKQKFKIKEDNERWYWSTDYIANEMQMEIE